jgi:hypothetical protein
MTFPQLALLAGTRGLLGAGIALLVADRLPEAQRRAVGWTLFLVGALTTIPLAVELFGASEVRDEAAWRGPRREMTPTYAG